jgi:hypothetical protein
VPEGKRTGRTGYEGEGDDDDGVEDVCHFGYLKRLFRMMGEVLGGRIGMCMDSWASSSAGDYTSRAAVAALSAGRMGFETRRW